MRGKFWLVVCGEVEHRFLEIRCYVDVGVVVDDFVFFGL